MKNLLKGVVILSLAIGSFVWGVQTSYAAMSLIDTATIGNGTTAYLNGAKGGDAKICLKDAPGGANVTLYDDDGDSRTLIKSTSFWSNGYCYTFNVDPYVDGADNDAEFIVITSRDIIGTIKFELWD